MRETDRQTHRERERVETERAERDIEGVGGKSRFLPLAFVLFLSYDASSFVFF